MTWLNNSPDAGHPCFVQRCRVNSLERLALVFIDAMGFEYIILIHCKKLLPKPYFCRIWNIKCHSTWSKAFSASVCARSSWVRESFVCILNDVEKFPSIVRWISIFLWDQFGHCVLAFQLHNEAVQQKLWWGFYNPGLPMLYENN